MATIEIPQRLQEEFERTARLLYENDSVRQALIEAIELWLAQHRETPLEEVAPIANDQAYKKLMAELERDHSGKWIVIAEGKLQGVGASLAEVEHLASDVEDRIIMQVGQNRPKEVELGWQMTFA